MIKLKSIIKRSKRLKTDCPQAVLFYKEINCTELMYLHSTISEPVEVNETDPIIVRSSCSINNGGCCQICTNTTEGRICSCEEGFQLNDDGFSCSGD